MRRLIEFDDLIGGKCSRIGQNHYRRIARLKSQHHAELEFTQLSFFPSSSINLQSADTQKLLRASDKSQLN